MTSLHQAVVRDAVLNGIESWSHGVNGGGLAMDGTHGGGPVVILRGKPTCELGGCIIRGTHAGFSICLRTIGVFSLVIYRNYSSVLCWLLIISILLMVVRLPCCTSSTSRTEVKHGC